MKLISQTLRKFIKILVGKLQLLAKLAGCKKGPPPPRLDEPLHQSP